jgi:hypothetical protein
MSSNQAFLAHVILFRSKLRARNTKLKQYKTPNTTQTDHEQTIVLRKFERKAVRKIHGQAKADKGHIIKGRYCKFYKVPPARKVW